jgi:hypothetical protein
MTIPDNALTVVVYAVIGLVVFLIVFFTLFPKRAVRTVNYMLRTYQEWRQVRADPNAEIEVPSFETRKPFPKVPRIEKEPEL